MDSIRVIALLAHPILACVLIYWIWQQYSWRKKGTTLKGEERKKALALHEKNGSLMVWAATAVILIAFIGRMIAGWRTNGDFLSEIWPTNLHGFIGPLGLILFVVMTNMGKKVKKMRLAGEKTNLEKLKHGRAADFLMVLIFIHAFLGFLYLFSIL